VKELGDEVIFFVIKGCSTERTDGKCIIDRLAFIVPFTRGFAFRENERN
jgi:transposase